MEHFRNLQIIQGVYFLLAYLDAGTGSLIIQVLIGIVAGGAVTVKLFWGKITRRFRRNKAPDEKLGKETEKPE